MGWLASLFLSSESSQSSRKGQALSSTHEAFSLPTSSPISASHPDAFHPESLNTPDPDSAISPSYTYPPQGGNSYGYVPTSAGLRSRPGSLLPTHHDPMHTPLSPILSYPPLPHTWNRLRAWLGREYPELGDTLNYGILPQDLAQIENQFGFALPAVVRESYLAVDGQEAESAAGCSEGLFFGLTLLPLEDVLEEWRFWREVDQDPQTGANHQLRDVMQSIPPGWVRKAYSQRGWIPLIADKAGNYAGIDLNPDEGGSVGQVIVFGRDFDTKVVLWKGDGPTGWARWLDSFVEELESGEGYEIGASGEGSDGSEDDVGYESYFYDGSGRGQGDGGGDAGSGGGLRLIGDYRGWNVLEAWADRSLRKWHEVGLLPEASLLPAQGDVKGKGIDKVGLGVLDLTQESSAEVVIPVLADIDAPSSSSTASPISDRNLQPPPSLPTISVTKPPAPLPVALPTPNDILSLPSPRQPAHSFDEDLEAGHSQGMREVYRESDSGLVSTSRKAPKSKPQSPVQDEASDYSTSILTAAEPEPIRGRVLTPPPAKVRPSPTVEIPDLLSAPAPAIEMKPIEPSSPASLLSEIPPAASEPMVDVLEPDVVEEQAEPVVEPIVEPTVQTTVEPVADPVDEEEVEEAVDPNSTIRLVGGGGTAGSIIAPATPGTPDLPAEETVQTDGEADTDVASVASSPEMGKASKPHKKTKSGLAGLKKFGHLGGLRKKGSGGSAKDVVPSAT